MKKIVFYGVKRIGSSGYEGTTPRMDSIEEVVSWYHKHNEDGEPLELVGKYAEAKDGTVTHIQDYKVNVVWEEFNGD